MPAVLLFRSADTPSQSHLIFSLRFLRGKRWEEGRRQILRMMEKEFPLAVSELLLFPPHILESFFCRFEDRERFLSHSSSKMFPNSLAHSSYVLFLRRITRFDDKQQRHEMKYRHIQNRQVQEHSPRLLLRLSSDQPTVFTHVRAD